MGCIFPFVIEENANILWKCGQMVNLIKLFREKNAETMVYNKKNSIQFWDLNAPHACAWAMFAVLQLLLLLELTGNDTANTDGR